MEVRADDAETYAIAVFELAARRPMRPHWRSCRPFSRETMLMSRILCETEPL